MFIIAGARRVRKQLGVAADFCPVCRDFRAVLVTELRRVPHVYWLPVGRGATLACEVECTRCRSVFGAPRADYAGYSPSFERDIAELARRTNPDILARTRPRIDAEDRLRAGKLGPAERDMLIAEPFAALDYMVQRRWGRATISGVAVAAIAAAAGLMVAALTLAASGAGADVALVLGVMVMPAAVVAVVALIHGPRAWIRRHIQPRLVAALAPLNPTPEELDRAIRLACTASPVLAPRVDAPGLLAAIRRLAGTGAPDPDAPVGN